MHASDSEAALLGLMTVEEVDAWVADALRAVTGAEAAETTFRAGRIDVVHGVTTTRGDEVVVKVYRKPVDVQARTVTARVQATLAERGFPCAVPLGGPVVVDDQVVSVETRVGGAPGDTGDREVRRAIASGLAEVIRILRDVPGLAGDVPPGPAWTRYQRGPWPVPHDSFFNFTATPDEYRWLDDYAEDASALLRTGRGEVVVGHGDWYSGNLTFDGDRLVGAVDWDLVADRVPVIAGFSAGGYFADRVPEPGDSVEFLTDFENEWGTAFTPAEQQLAVAAAAWVQAFNARCDITLHAAGMPSNGALQAVEQHGRRLLDLRW